MTEPKVIAVTVEVQKSERSIRQGIIAPERIAVREWAADRFGWTGRVTVTVDRLSADGLATLTVRSA